MSEPFLGEVRIMSFNFPPKGWAFANGQTLPINQNQALFALLGTMYGGNGQTNFMLPNFQGRVPVHVGTGFVQGQTGGESAHTISAAEMPQHGHLVRANPGQPAQQNPQNPSATRRLSASQPGNIWGPPTNLANMHPAQIGNVGGSQAHTNQQPYLVLNFCIALQGIFPSRN